MVVARLTIFGIEWYGILERNKIIIPYIPKNYIYKEKHSIEILIKNKWNNEYIIFFYYILFIWFYSLGLPFTGVYISHLIKSYL